VPEARKFKNPHRIPVRQVAQDAGYPDLHDALNHWCIDSVVPACCDEGCEVEPDGRCEHNCPSALLAVGLI
jgi:hypothetical protein